MYIRRSSTLNNSIELKQLTRRQYCARTFAFNGQSLKPLPWKVQFWLLRALQRQVWQLASQVPLLGPLLVPLLEQQQAS
jgi:hypothetical protein